MKTNYMIEIKSKATTQCVDLVCTNRQATRAFVALAYAMAGGTYSEINLYVDGTHERVKINGARFKGVDHV